MKLLIDFINKINPIPRESRDKLFSLIRLKELKKGDSIAKLGETPNDFYILRSGVIRSFYTDEKGKEYIRHLFTSSKVTGALGALVLDKPSRLSYDCLLDCEVYAINFKEFKTKNKKLFINVGYSKYIPVSRGLQTLIKNQFRITTNK